MMSGRSNRYPFTASQWQELEHQALIFKYMATGTPIPPDLLLPIRRSFLLDSTTTSPTLAFSPQPTIGWDCFQMGIGRKPEDPEPGRCKRTDGKKWRCSKEAYPDSKYCERHMHRGKNRSRKHVEMSLATNPTTQTPISTSSYPSSPYPPPLYMAGSTTHHLIHPYLSSSRPPGIVLSPQNINFNTDNGSYYSSDKEYRYFHGLKEDLEEYKSFPEGSVTERESHLRFTPLGKSSLGEGKQRRYPVLEQSTYSDFATDLCKEEEVVEKHQHCFVLGEDFKLEKPVTVERKEEPQKHLRHFFDEWPQKNKGSWMDLEEERLNQASYSKTQLSISIPVAHHDFPIAGSLYRNDD